MFKLLSARFDWIRSILLFLIGNFVVASFNFYLFYFIYKADPGGHSLLLHYMVFIIFIPFVALALNFVQLIGALIFNFRLFKNKGFQKLKLMVKGITAATFLWTSLFLVSLVLEAAKEYMSDFDKRIYYVVNYTLLTFGFVFLFISVQAGIRTLLEIKFPRNQIDVKKDDEEVYDFEKYNKTFDIEPVDDEISIGEFFIGMFSKKTLFLSLAIWCSVGFVWKILSLKYSNDPAASQANLSEAYLLGRKIGSITYLIFTGLGALLFWGRVYGVHSKTPQAEGMLDTSSLD